MVEFMSYEDDFFVEIKENKKKVVLYGAGAIGSRVYPYIENVSYVCDQKADGEQKLYEHIIINLDELKKSEKEKVNILICINNKEKREEVRKIISEKNINAKVFDYFNNIAFAHGNVYRNIEDKIKNKLNKVRIVCQDEGWILNKFAIRMKDKLIKKGILADIDKCIDPTADINHHIAFHIFEPIKAYNDTLMITHVDSLKKLNLLKEQLKIAKMGICMSKDTMEMLVLNGVSREKLCYVNPAHDGDMNIKKYVLGITHRCYEEIDNRKRTSALVDICRTLNPSYFKFKIMGSGWDDIVNTIRQKGFEVDYYDEFDKDVYKELIPSLDYYLFFGFDEGSMGYLDALVAGVETIVTPQGFHLDVKDGITCSCRTINEFSEVLLELQKKREKRHKSVEMWTWESYVDKHIHIWNYILGNTDNILEDKHWYLDGINSVLSYDA